MGQRSEGTRRKRLANNPQIPGGQQVGHGRRERGAVLQRQRVRQRNRSLVLRDQRQGKQRHQRVVQRNCAAAKQARATYRPPRVLNHLASEAEEK